MTNKVVSKTLNIFYTKGKIFRKKYWISCFIIFDFSDSFFEDQIKFKKFVFIIQIFSKYLTYSLEILGHKSWSISAPACKVSRL